MCCSVSAFEFITFVLYEQDAFCTAHCRGEDAMKRISEIPGTAVLVPTHGTNEFSITTPEFLSSPVIQD